MRFFTNSNNITQYTSNHSSLQSRVQLNHNNYYVKRHATILCKQLYENSE